MRTKKNMFTLIRGNPYTPENRRTGWQRLTTPMVLALAVLMCVTPARALVDLIVYNSFPLLNSDGVTPLLGNAGSGDRVQLILAGANGLIDAPDAFGNPGGDDLLLLPPIGLPTNSLTHVGAGTLGSDHGFLVQDSVFYDNPQIGLPVYVRFWNAPSPATATYYGNSLLFVLPAPDVFGFADLDFAPEEGSPRTANIAFGSLAVVPEPGQLFLLGLVMVGCWLWRKHRRRFGNAAALTVLLATMGSSGYAQLSPPLDVTASRPIGNTDNSLLVGNNPHAALFGFEVVPGCLVQVLQVGPNGLADMPALNGNPGGDDTVVATTSIGQGIAPNVAVSGRFSVSVYPPPAAGTKLYARVFNAPTMAAATHWMQSATFTVRDVDVMDVSALGLSATTQPKGTNPTLTDTDGDGQSDYAELIANTDALDGSDQFEVYAIDRTGQPPSLVRIGVAARAGRVYTLQRTTAELTAAATLNDLPWVNVTATGPFGAETDLVLSDTNPPDSPKAFYRVKVTMP